MATISEDYVSFETAKLLKKKGFNERCTHYYKNEKYLVDLGYTNIHSYTNSDLVEEFAAPTLQMTCKWLREVYKIHIIAEPCLGEGSEPNLSFNRWFWTILIESGEYKPIRRIDEFPTYEGACEAAIKYCLENLI